MMRNFYPPPHVVLTRILLICCSGFLFFACQKIGDQDGNSTRIKTNYVTESEVNNLLKTMSDGMKTKGNLSPAFNTIKSTTPIADSAGTTIYYVVNYEPTGFIIMAADNRVEPILAFSETSNFDVENIADANGLAVWDGMTKSYVQAVRQENEPQTPEQLLAWEPENLSRVVGRSAQPEPDPPTDPDGRPYDGGGSGGGSGGNGIDPSYCICDLVDTSGKLLNTTWIQRVGYNHYFPNYNCKASGKLDDRVPAGCVPLAMGQIMRYYKWPVNEFNWSEMQDMGATPAVAIMLYVLATKAKASYSCDGTTVSMEEAASVLREYNYPNAQSSGYDEAKVVANLKQGHPVILAGGRKAGSILFPRSADDHAWVCDGYRRTYTCAQHFRSGYTYLSMKWGQYESDDWYLSTHWNPSYTVKKGYVYDYNLKMLYNIIPAYQL